MKFRIVFGSERLRIIRLSKIAFFHQTMFANFRKQSATVNVGNYVYNRTNSIQNQIHGDQNATQIRRQSDQHQTGLQTQKTPVRQISHRIHHQNCDQQQKIITNFQRKILHLCQKNHRNHAENGGPVQTEDRPNRKHYAGHSMFENT